MSKGNCLGCRAWTNDLSYPAGGLCPACREAAARRREDERRGRELAYQRAVAELRQDRFFPWARDQVLEAALRRLRQDDRRSVLETIGVALQRGRPDIAQKLVEHARKARMDVTGWEKMIPDRLNPRG